MADQPITLMILLMNWKKPFSIVSNKANENIGLSFHETQIYRFKVINNASFKPFSMRHVRKDIRA